MRASEQRRAAGLAVVAFVLLLGLVQAQAQQKDDPESRLRAALRTATVQLRQLEDQNATLQAKQSENERDTLALTQKAAAQEEELAKLRSDAKETQTALQQAKDQLQSVSAALDQERANFGKLQAAYQEAATMARTRDADATRFEASLVETRQRADNCQDKNDKLYKLGLEILGLYDKKGVFQSLASSEPVTGIKRVELENLVQDYQDKLLDNKVQPPGPRTSQPQ